MEAFGSPTITPEVFGAVLAAAASPVLAERPALQYFGAIQRYGLDPAFMLAIFAHESRFGTDPAAVVNRYSTRNWGNTRTKVADVPGNVIITDRGPFVAFATWLDGLKDACARLIAPDLPYAKADAKTVEAIIPIWAPKTDSNDPAGYVAAVLSLMAKWAAEGGSDKEGRRPVNVIQKLLPDGMNHWAGRDGHSVKAVVLHIAEGLEPSVTGWFNNPRAEVSAHYLVCKDGLVIQYVRESDRAWANGPMNRSNLANPIIARWASQGINPNDETVSIEHEGYHGNPTVLTDAQLRAGAALVSDICDRYGLPKDETHILGHYEIDGVNKAGCPGFDRAGWVAYLAAVNAPVQAATPQPAPAGPNPGFPGAIQPDGRTILNGVDFGGEAVTAEEVIVQVRNAAGKRYRRRWVGYRLDPWEAL